MHKHKEAFCIMTYKCEKCGKVEKIYNSRDGVTPFIIGCDDGCGGEMMHIDWHSDMYNPVYKPQEGERIFIDFSKEDYKSFITAEIGSGKFDMYLKEESVENVARVLLNNWHEGLPRLVKVGIV